MRNIRFLSHRSTLYWAPPADGGAGSPTAQSHDPVVTTLSSVDFIELLSEADEMLPIEIDADSGESEGIENDSQLARQELYLAPINVKSNVVGQRREPIQIIFNAFNATRYWDFTAVYLLYYLEHV